MLAHDARFKLNPNGWMREAGQKRADLVNSASCLALKNGSAFAINTAKCKSPQQHI
ncbi:hypothetical protein [Roseobacter weihaiensis]|uniref:hypothetical protein n=1 Tax=Roseobacter weihaiensis TaxID=2763262 RepID=UPI001D0BDD8F|nr:hypothetical protein [Roseobacter sp. H9]